MVSEQPPSVLSEFGQWATDLQITDVPETVRRKTKIQIANMIAAASAGANSQADTVTNGLQEAAGSGKCTTVTGGRTDSITAYFLNATRSMMHDFDDYCFMGHTCHSAVFASLAVGEYVDASGEDVLRAIVLANELGGRLGASASNGPLSGQRWTFIHRAEAAAATAALLDEDSDGIANAISLAMYDPPYPLMPGFMGGDSKAFSAASTGSDGIRAALFGRAGARGYDRILEDRKGFFEKFAYLPYPEMFTGFGESWVSETLSYKPHPGCAYIQAPLDCMAEIQQKTEITDEDVASISVDVGLRAFSMESKSRPYRTDERIPPVNVTFSVPLSLAIYLIEGEFTTRQLTDEYLRKNLDRITELREKTTLSHDPEYTRAAAQGINTAVDFGPLFRDRRDDEIVEAFLKSTEAASGYDDLAGLTGDDTTGEEMPLVVSYTAELIDGPLNWEQFDLGKVSFEDFAFNFGCAVEVETVSGDVYSADRIRHRGAAGEGIEDTAEMVYGKLQEEVFDLLGSEEEAARIQDTIRDIEDNAIKELMEPLAV